MFKQLVLLLKFLSVVNVIIGSDYEFIDHSDERFVPLLSKLSKVKYFIINNQGKSISGFDLDPARPNYWARIERSVVDAQICGKIIGCCIVHNRTDMTCILKFEIDRKSSN